MSSLREEAVNRFLRDAVGIRVHNQSRKGVEKTFAQDWYFYARDRVVGNSYAAIDTNVGDLVREQIRVELLPDD